MRRHESKELQKIISEYHQKTPNTTVGVEMNGNTPSPLSPTSVGSQVNNNFLKIQLNKNDFRFF